MTTGFVLEARREGGTALSFDAGAPERSDFSFAEGESGQAVVLGSPYGDGPGWVTAEDVLVLARSERLSFPREMHGFFAVIAGDSRTGEFIVATDRFRGIDLFISRREDGVIISDSVERIACRLPSLHVDAQGMLEFLELGHMLCDRTQFEEIERIPPSTILEIRDGGVARSESYWHYAEVPAGEESPRRAADIFCGHVRDSLELCDRAALFLTAGIDSRAILSACPSNDARVRCFTFGNPWNTDSRIAPRLCRKAGLSHSFHPVDRDDFTRQMEKLPLFAVDSNGTVNFLLFAPAFESFDTAGENCDLVLTGIGGEFLRGGLLFTQGSMPETPEELISRMINGYSVNPSERLLQSPDGTSAREEVGSAFRRIIRQRAGDELSLRFECYYIENRVANFTSSATQPAGRRMKIWDAWLNTGILEAARSISIESKVKREVHHRVITSNSPELAGLSLTNGDLVPGGSGQRYLKARSRAFRAGQLSLKALNKASRATLRREIYKPNYIRDCSHMLARHHGDLLQQRLRHGEMRLAAYVSPDELEGALQSFLRDDSRFCYVLTNLLCAELWLEHLSGSTSIIVA